MQTDQELQSADRVTLADDSVILAVDNPKPVSFLGSILRAPAFGGLFHARNLGEQEELQSREFTLEAAAMASDSAVSFLIVVAVVAYLAVSIDRLIMGAIIFALGLLSVIVRITVKAKVVSDDSVSPETLGKVHMQVVAATLLGTCMWVLSMATLYPNLSTESRMIYLVLLLGSTTVGAGFMTLAAPAYVLHITILFVTFVLTNLIQPTEHANFLSVLFLLFGYELFKVSLGSNTSSMRLASRLASAKYADAHVQNQLQQQVIENHAKLVATLRASSESKNLYLAKISHEFRAPLQIIVSNVDLLSALLRDHPKKQVENSLQNLETASEQLLAFSNDLAEYLRSNATQIKIKSEQIELIEFLSGCLSMHDVLAKKKGLGLRFNHSQASMPYSGDPVRLRQIVSNLLDNAVKYTSSGSIELDCDKQTDGRIFISVRDTGSGISPEGQRSIFEPWFRADESKQGTGLGLAIVKATADAIGATIELKSELGKGTQMTLVLPSPKGKKQL